MIIVSLGGVLLLEVDTGLQGGSRAKHWLVIGWAKPPEALGFLSKM